MAPCSHSVHEIASHGHIQWDCSLSTRGQPTAHLIFKHLFMHSFADIHRHPLWTQTQTHAHVDTALPSTIQWLVRFPLTGRLSCLHVIQMNGMHGGSTVPSSLCATRSANQNAFYTSCKLICIISLVKVTSYVCWPGGRAIYFFWTFSELRLAGVSGRTFHAAGRLYFMVPPRNSILCLLWCTSDITGPMALTCQVQPSGGPTLFFAIRWSRVEATACV